MDAVERLCISVSVFHVEADLDVHALVEKTGEEELGEHAQRRVRGQAAAVLGLVLLLLLAALVVLDHSQPGMFTCDLEEGNTRTVRLEN